VAKAATIRAARNLFISMDLGYVVEATPNWAAHRKRAVSSVG